jgi:hypothetical protein
MSTPHSHLGLLLLGFIDRRAGTGFARITMQVHKRDTLRWLAIDGQRVVAVLDDSDIQEARACCLQRYAAHIHVTSRRHASEAQRELAKRLPGRWARKGATMRNARHVRATNLVRRKVRGVPDFFTTWNLTDCARVVQ